MVQQKPTDGTYAGDLAALEQLEMLHHRSKKSCRRRAISQRRDSPGACTMVALRTANKASTQHRRNLGEAPLQLHGSTVNARLLHCIPVTLHCSSGGASLQPRQSSNVPDGAPLQPRRSSIATAAQLQCPRRCSIAVAAKLHCNRDKAPTPRRCSIAVAAERQHPSIAAPVMTADAATQHATAMAKAATKSMTTTTEAAM